MTLPSACWRSSQAASGSDHRSSKLDVRSQGFDTSTPRSGLAERFEPSTSSPRPGFILEMTPSVGSPVTLTIGTLQRVVEVGEDEADRTCPDQRGNRCQECGRERARADELIRCDRRLDDRQSSMRSSARATRGWRMSLEARWPCSGAPRAPVPHPPSWSACSTASAISAAVASICSRSVARSDRCLEASASRP